MKLYRLNDDYVSYLKTIENKVQDNYGGKRIYIGIVINIGSHKYFAPLSSHKKSQDKIKKNDTIFRLHSRTDEKGKLGLVHINNMIPTLDSELEEVIFSNEDIKYRNLLQKQYIFITSKKEEIHTQANRLYNRVVEMKEPFYVRLSCNFKLLEKEYTNFNKEIQNA